MNPRRETPHTVWAVSTYGEAPEERFTGSLGAAVDVAARIARSSAPEGAVSVWVESPQRIVWAAGVMAKHLQDTGLVLDYYGRVHSYMKPSVETPA